MAIADREPVAAEEVQDRVRAGEAQSLVPEEARARQRVGVALDAYGVRKRLDRVGDRGEQRIALGSQHVLAEPEEHVVGDQPDHEAAARIEDRLRLPLEVRRADRAVDLRLRGIELLLLFQLGLTRRGRALLGGALGGLLRDGRGRERVRDGRVLARQIGLRLGLARRDGSVVEDARAAGRGSRRRERLLERGSSVSNFVLFTIDMAYSTMNSAISSVIMSA